MLVRGQNWHYLNLLVLALLSSCITIKDARLCSVAGVTSAGAICAHTNNDLTEDLTLAELLDMLEAQPERECVPVKGMNVCKEIQIGDKIKLPARGAALIISSEDWAEKKTEMEITCRKMGNKCKYERVLETLKRTER